MPSEPSDLISASRARAGESTHVPGTVQPFGAVLGFEQNEMRIEYASANTDIVLGEECSTLLGTSLEALFSRDQIHDLRNAMARALGGNARVVIGIVPLNERCLSWAVCPSEGRFVLEFEPVSDLQDHGRGSLADFPQIVSRLNSMTTTQDVIEHLVAILAGVSQYDRLMAYRFDAEWNGEVVAEAVAPDWDSFLGLHFPQSDIPHEAYEITTNMPLHFIVDTAAPQIDLYAARDELPPLNLSLAELRGVSEIHRTYLQSMGAQATMTMSVTVGDKPWGAISFHHRSPRIPPTELRELLTALAPYLSSKLMSLLFAKMLTLRDDVDQIRDRIEANTGSERALDTGFESVADAIRERFDVAAIAVGRGDAEIRILGDAPLNLIRAAQEKARTTEDGIWHSDHLARDLGGDITSSQPICGALCLDRGNGDWICLLRNATTEEARWVGAPDTQSNDVGGIKCLEPRGSFSVYKQLAEDRSKPWQLKDIWLLQGVSASIIAASQLEHLLTAMQRQHELVVDELKHRARNMIALTRSISRQAAGSNTTIDGYRDAMERRMNALSVAHDLIASQPRETAALKHIIQLAAIPYAEGRPDVVTIEGPDIGMTAEAGLLMALAIHELVTNAVKYGALSTGNGLVTIATSKTASGARLTWTEQDGPAVNPPEFMGCGTMLIEKAIPSELGGESELHFHRSGVTASIFIPSNMLAELEDDTMPVAPAQRQAPIRVLVEGTVLVVEDNLVIGMDLTSSLNEIGYRDVELVSSLPQARGVLADNAVICAILDINLGRGGSSIELAYELERADIPFFFVTGYGEVAPLPDDLDTHLKLQKPLSRANLAAALGTFLPKEIETS